MNLKKLLIALFVLFFSFWSNIGLWQEDLDWIIWNILWSIWNTDNSFGFDTNANITFGTQTNNSLEISFPIVTKSWAKINKYNVFASTFSINNPDSIDNIDYSDSNAMKDVNFDIPQSQLDSGIANITLSWINNNTKYYITITPIDPNGVYGVSSTEKSIDIWTPWSSNNSDNTHSAWSSNLALANISHTNNWLIVTVTWTELDWADEIEFFYKNLSDWWDDMTSLWKADMSDESYTFSLPVAWTYIIKLQPMNWSSVAWTEFHYNLTISWTTPPTTPTTPTTPTKPIPVTPPWWPKENAIVIWIFSVLWYFIYKKWYIKN